MRFRRAIANRRCYYTHDILARKHERSRSTRGASRHWKMGARRRPVAVLLRARAARRPPARDKRPRTTPVHPASLPRRPPAAWLTPAPHPARARTDSTHSNSLHFAGWWPSRRSRGSQSPCMATSSPASTQRLLLVRSVAAAAAGHTPTRHPAYTGVHPSRQKYRKANKQARETRVSTVHSSLYLQGCNDMQYRVR